MPTALAIVSDEGVADWRGYPWRCTDFVLRRTRGPVVVNVSTSMMVDEIAGR